MGQPGLEMLFPLLFRIITEFFIVNCQNALYCRRLASLQLCKYLGQYRTPVCDALILAGPYNFSNPVFQLRICTY